MRQDDVRARISSQNCPGGSLRERGFDCRRTVALKPELAAIAAARMVLREIDRLATERVDFAFETTLSGRMHVRRMETWKRAGHRIEIVYLRLDSIDLALRRIEARVRQG